MNVIFITRKWPPALGGMETYSKELVNKLKVLCSLKVLALSGKKNGEPPAAWRLALFMFSCVFNVCFAKRYDVYHIGDLVLWPLAIFAGLRNSSGSLVITAYGLDIVYGSRKGLMPWLYRNYLALGRRMLSDKVKIIAISNATADLCKDIGFKNIRVVPLGVSGEFSSPVERSRISEQYVLFVGRLVKRKGASWFSENVLPILDARVRMKVVGKVWDSEEFEALNRNEKVDYLGVVSDGQLKHLRSGSVAVLMPNIPSDGLDIEGFGLTALEAARDGGVLIASELEGITDAVIDRKTGFLLPSQCASSWVDKIGELVEWTDDDRKMFVREAQDVISNKFSWKAVAENTLKAYQ